MATHAELNAIMTESVVGAQALREKVFVACVIAASIIVEGEDTADPPWATGNHAQRLKWVDRLLSMPYSTTKEIFSLVVAANASSPQAGILSASDAVIQGNVNEMIDALSTNLA